MLGQLQRYGRYSGCRAPAQEIIRPNGHIPEQLREWGQNNPLWVGVERVRQHLTVTIEISPDVRASIASIV